MEENQCKNCGAMVDFESTTKCPYCGTAYTKKENEDSEPKQVIINNYYNGEKEEDETPTYTSNKNLNINVPVLVILWVVFPLLGFIYLVKKLSDAHHTK